MVNLKKLLMIALIRIYSVGVWNNMQIVKSDYDLKLEFTPLEFETS